MAVNILYIPAFSMEIVNLLSGIIILRDQLFPQLTVSE